MFQRILLVMSAVALLSSCAVNPTPITKSERADRIYRDKHAMFDCQEPIHSTISLNEAIARSLKYNLDLKLKTADAVLAKNDFRVSRFDMLPDIVANYGYATRSNEYAVKSSPTSGAISFSQDRHRRILDLQMTWNIIDFGISYVNAKQEADQYLIALERRRKMQQNITRDVRYAYYRAVSAQKLLRSLNPMIDQVQTALNKSKKLESQQTQSPLEALNYQKSLIKTMRELAVLRRELTNAKKELGALMNLSPSTQFSVVESPSRFPRALPRQFPTHRKELEYLALQYRPEIREEDYRTRISTNEITKAKLRLFPGLEVNAGYNHDSNGFLVNNAWANYGAQLTWNLIKLVSAKSSIDRAKSELMVSDIRRMALSMAIMTQVDIAQLRHKEMAQDLEVATRERDISKRIYQQVREAHSADKKSELDLIHAKTEMILGQLRYDLTFAEYQNSAGQLMNSTGYDILPIVNTSKSVAVLSREISHAMNQEPVWIRDKYARHSDGRVGKIRFAKGKGALPAPALKHAWVAPKNPRPDLSKVKRLTHIKALEYQSKRPEKVLDTPREIVIKAGKPNHAKGKSNLASANPESQQGKPTPGLNYNKRPKVLAKHTPPKKPSQDDIFANPGLPEEITF